MKKRKEKYNTTALLNIKRQKHMMNTGRQPKVELSKRNHSCSVFQLRLYFTNMLMIEMKPCIAEKAVNQIAAEYAVPCCTVPPFPISVAKSTIFNVKPTNALKSAADKRLKPADIKRSFGNVYTGLYAKVEAMLNVSPAIRIASSDGL